LGTDKKTRSKLKYSYPEHNAKNINVAIKQAEYLKSTGEYDLFRGQRKCYKIKPSIFRDGVDLNEANQSLGDFAQWVHETPDLESLHYNQDAILAVAQHYGIKTSLIDFSYSPKIAGFFASDGAIDGDIGTIICLNKKKLTNSWKDINSNYRSDKGTNLVELIEIDVNNLWRLQAQEGAFLKSHVDEKFLEMMSCFLHIYFPQNTKLKILEKDKIYPINKSHLEVLLEQYFLIDTYNDRNNFLTELGGEPIVEILPSQIQDAVESFFKTNKIPDIHKSWKTEFAKSWLIEVKEDYDETNFVTERIIFNTKIKDPIKFETEIFLNIENLLLTNEKYFVRWEVKSENDKILYVNDEGGITLTRNEETAFSIEDMVNTIYSSMRYLPYKTSQIATSISRYLTMIKFSTSIIIDNNSLIELSGAGIRGLGICNEIELIKAIRLDFLDFIKSEKLNTMNKLDSRDLIFAAIFTKSSYVFEDFVTLFVKYLIPSQATIAIENLVIGCNPMRIDIVAHG